jgi:hypothetical protein
LIVSTESILRVESSEADQRRMGSEERIKNKRREQEKDVHCQTIS